MQRELNIAKALTCMAVLLSGLQLVPAQSPDGAALYKQQCLKCHEDPNEKRAPSFAAMRLMPPEKILWTLESGVMFPQGLLLTPEQRRVVAEYLSDKPLPPATPNKTKPKTGGKSLTRAASMKPVSLDTAPERRRISPLRDFSADHGYFFQSGNTVDVYTMDTERSITRRIGPNVTQTEAHYFRDRYVFLRGSWRGVFHKTVTGPKEYLDLGPCDALDQIDISQFDVPTRDLLGDSKIKSVRKIISGTDLVLYSTQEKGETVLHVALVDVDLQSRQSKRVIQTVNLGSDRYCGYRLVRLVGQERRRLFFAYFHENGGGPSDVRIIKSYLIEF